MRRVPIKFFPALTVLLVAHFLGAQSATLAFPPLEQWKNAVAHNDASALRSLYSSTPPTEIDTPGGRLSPDANLAFWRGLGVQSLRVDNLKAETPQPGIEQVVFQAKIRGTKGDLYLSEAQLWQDQHGQWRIVAIKRTNAAPLPQPLTMEKSIYPAGDARAEIQHALAAAGKDHKRVLLVFGANWCYDCHVLDAAFHSPELAPVVEKNFEVVHVDIGEGDKNQDLMQQYEVPMKRGIPGVAVLASDGKLLFSQKAGEFANARAMAPADLLQFLNRWKPPPSLSR
jgi:thioredoxin 1